MLNKIRYFFTARKIRRLGKKLLFDDSEFLRINLGCLGRPCYGYVNIDETRTNRRVFVSSFKDLPFEDKSVSRILLDYQSIVEKKDGELKAVFKELERVSVSGCILSIDNFDSRLEDILKKYGFIAFSAGYNRLFSVKSFIYNLKNETGKLIENASRDLEKKDNLKITVSKDAGFFDKASIAQIFSENSITLDSIDARPGSIEATLSKNIIVPQKKRRVCAIGQYMLLKYAQLGFSWDGWSRAFERLGMDYLLLEGMRHIDPKKMQEAIISFKPDLVFVVLKDTIPAVWDIRKKLRSMGTQVVYWFCDPEHPKKQDISPLVDVMFLTNRGQIDEYRNAFNLKRVYYMPQGYDPYVQHGLRLAEDCDIAFAGIASDAPLHMTRRELIDALKERYNVRVSNTSRNNISEFYGRSKTAFGASDFDFELYTSNRFFVALGCGACYVTKRFKGIELLAENRKHLLYFEDKEELFDILDYYLSHDAEREKIRRDAESLALEKHTYVKRMRNVLDILDGKTEKFYGFLP